MMRQVEVLVPSNGVEVDVMVDHHSLSRIILNSCCTSKPDSDGIVTGAHLSPNSDVHHNLIETSEPRESLVLSLVLHHHPIVEVAQKGNMVSVEEVITLKAVVQLHLPTLDDVRTLPR